MPALAELLHLCCPLVVCVIHGNTVMKVYQGLGWSLDTVSTVIRRPKGSRSLMTIVKTDVSDWSNGTAAYSFEVICNSTADVLYKSPILLEIKLFTYFDKQIFKIEFVLYF